MTTGVRYTQLEQASRIQNENKWDLEETIRQAEQKFTTDLKTIATETSNDEKLLKTLVCLERRTLDQIPDEYKPYKKQLSLRFGVVFYEDRIIIPKALRYTIIMLLHKGHAAINKMMAAAKLFWWPLQHKTYSKIAMNAFRAKWQVRTLNHNYRRLNLTTYQR